MIKFLKFLLKGSLMKTKCEVMVKDMLPSLRAMIAIELMGRGLSQTDIAKKLGVSQPAVSQYTKQLRGINKIKIDNNEIKFLCDDICSNKLDIDDFCRICKTVTKNDCGIK